MIARIIFVGILVWSLTGCGDSDSDDSGSGNALTDALELDSGNAVIGNAQAALQSSNFGALDTNTDALETGLLLQDEGDDEEEEDDSDQSENDELCSENADPWDSDNDKVKVGGDGYTSQFFYCKVASNTVESNDSIPGALAQNKSIVCMVEDHFEVTLDDYTEDGNELVDGDSETVEFTSDCWPQGTPDGMTEIALDSVKLTALAESTGYQYQITIQAADQVDLTLQFFNADGVFGFKNQEPGNDPGVGTHQSIVVDSNNGVVFANIYEDRNGAGGSDSVYRGVTRLRIKGVFDENLSFSEITEGHGYYMVSGPGFEATSNDEFTYSMYTAAGNSDSGFRFLQWAVENDGDTPSIRDNTTDCDGGDGDCEDIDNIGSAEDLDKQARRPDDTKDAWLDYMDSGLPMCEPSEDGPGSITYDPAPVSTGALGQCAE